MFKNSTAIAILLVLLVLSVSCNRPAPQPAPSSPPTEGEVAPPAGQAADPTQTPLSGFFLPQIMNSSAGFNSEPGDSAVRYLWPRALPGDWTINPEKSYADESGFSLEMSSPAVQVAIMGGDIASPAWDLAVASGSPLQVRGASGYSFDTGAGFTLHWLEGGQYYVAGGIGLSLADAQALVAALDALSLAEFQARLAQ